MTLKELIALGAKQFRAAHIQYGQGTLTARDEARWLALAAIRLAVDSDVDVEERVLTARQVSQVQRFFDRRVHERLPAAYITGTAWLKGFEFKVDSRVIIPRSFIAELILSRFKPWLKRASSARRILDLCTGSGCLAIMAASRFPKAQVVASDLSRDALNVAAANVRAYGLGHRIKLCASDLFDSLNEEPFDIIICNPPYVPHTKRNKLPKEFLHEPEMALMADDKGMALVKRVIADAGNYLTASGLLAIEIGHERAACEAMLARDFAGLTPLWIETAEQSDNVFLIHASELRDHTRRQAP